MKKDLSATINLLATESVRLMSQTEKEQFFTDCPNVKRYYIKGNQKGLEREVYHIDGSKFNKLWAHLEAYAWKSARTSGYYDKIMQEDLVSEIKQRVFVVLRYWGSTPSNQNFYKFFPCIVDNVLTSRYKSEQLSVEQQYNLVNLNDQVDELEGTLQVEKIRNHSTSDVDDMEFWASVPTALQSAVKDLLDGYSFAEAAKKEGVCYSNLRNRVLNWVRNDYALSVQ